LLLHLDEALRLITVVVLVVQCGRHKRIGVEPLNVVILVLVLLFKS
jgi:hypothetical protein